MEDNELININNNSTSSCDFSILSFLACMAMVFAQFYLTDLQSSQPYESIRAPIVSEKKANSVEILKASKALNLCKKQLIKQRKRSKTLSQAHDETKTKTAKYKLEISKLSEKASICELKRVSQANEIKSEMKLLHFQECSEKLRMKSQQCAESLESENKKLESIINENSKKMESMLNGKEEYCNSKLNEKMNGINRLEDAIEKTRIEMANQSEDFKATISSNDFEFQAQISNCESKASAELKKNEKEFYLRLETERVARESQIDKQLLSIKENYKQQMAMKSNQLNVILTENEECSSAVKHLSKENKNMITMNEELSVILTEHEDEREMQLFANEEAHSQCTTELAQHIQIMNSQANEIVRYETDLQQCQRDLETNSIITNDQMMKLKTKDTSEIYEETMMKECAPKRNLYTDVWAPFVVLMSSAYILQYYW